MTTSRLTTETLELVRAAVAAGARSATVELVAEPGRLPAGGHPARIRVELEWHDGTTDAAETPTDAAVAPSPELLPLPWDNYAPELREALKNLARTYSADAVAAAAARFAEIVAEHGPAAAVRSTTTGTAGRRDG